MVAQPQRFGFDDDEVEPRRQRRQRPSVRQGAGRDQGPCSVPDVAALAEIDRLLGQAERPRRPEPDLHDDEPVWRTGVDREEVDLVPSDPHVPAEDRPAQADETPRDQRLGVVAEPLGVRAAPNPGPGIHDPSVTRGPNAPVTGRSPGACHGPPSAKPVISDACEDPRMANRERPGDRGRRRATQARLRLADELRRGRVGSGLSLRDVGAAAGIDPTRIWRFERGRGTNLRLEDIGAIAAVLGQELTIRTYPAGDAVRDAGHARLLERFRRELHFSLRWHTEVPFPEPGDLRAWDAVTGAAAWRAGIEAETVIDDSQALDRKIALKRRDGAVDHVVLLVADTIRNRRALSAVPSSFADLPLRTRAILGALRAGIEPAESGIVLL
jgi:transcriptional regulator with XRE-family HTH domain